MKTLDLFNNKLRSLPSEIGNLINLERLDLTNNQLSSLPNEIEKIHKEIIEIDESSYEINNLKDDCEILIFSSLNINITNLPMSITKIFLKEGVCESLIKKIPFGCEIYYF